MPILYTTQASSVGGREGEAKIVGGKFKVAFSLPQELGGPGGEGTNPEELFALAYSSCFLGALQYVASQEKVELPKTTSVNASIGVGPRDDQQGFGISAEIIVTIPDFDDKAQAQELIKKADVVCPYSHALRGNVDVKVALA